MIRHASIRLRLTLWYGVVLATVLVAFSASVYLLMRHNLLALTDAGLAEELTELADEIGTVTSPGSPGPRYAQQAQHEGYEFQVASPDGRVLFRSDRLGAESLPTAGPDPGRGRRTTRASASMGSGTSGWRRAGCRYQAALICYKLGRPWALSTTPCGSC